MTHEQPIGQSHDFWRAYGLFVTLVASFVLKRSEGAKDATRDTNKPYARQKWCNYHYYQYTRPNRTNSFNKENTFNRDVAWTMVWKVVIATIRLAAKQEQKVIHENSRQLWHWNGIHRIILVERSCLTSLLPIRSRGANAFSARAFSVWLAKRRVLQRAVCHLAARIDNNERLTSELIQTFHFFRFI